MQGSAGISRAAVAAMLLGGTALAANPSLCITEDPGCSIVDGQVKLRVTLGQAETLITSGFFHVEYDPAVFEFRSIAPGSACDGDSPFVFKMSEFIDPVAGRVSMGVSVDIIEGDPGTTGPATMACVTFVRRAMGSSDVCLVELPFPDNMRLIDWQGLDVGVDNSTACPATFPDLSCATIASAGLNCASCGALAPDCSHLDDTCNVGVCASGPPYARCITNSANEGGACNDGNTCTQTDICVHGDCIGTDCPDPSLCVVAAPVCPVVGGLARFEIELGAGEPLVSGAQFSIQYDPAALQFVSILPGQSCDPASPFSNELLTIINHATGVLRFAVGIAIGGGSNGTTGPATVACLSFLVLEPNASTVCLFDEGNVFPSRLVGYPGQAISIDNADTCFSPLPPPILSCSEVTVSETCSCPGASADCSLLTTGCREGYCTGTPAHCESAATNEGGSCDDGNACTQVDACVAGECRGTDCDNQSVCILPSTDCAILDGQAGFAIRLGDGEPWVTQAQFLLDFNPGVLELIDILPGRYCDPASPFELEYHDEPEPGSHRVRYAVGVHPFQPGTGTQGPATLACATFRVIGSGSSDVCLLPGTNPFYSRLSDRWGNLVEVFNGDDCPPNNPASELSCEDLAVSESCFCEAGVVNCSAFDGPCARGVCQAGDPARCAIQPDNEGEACFNGNLCNHVGTCVEGLCVTEDCPQYPSLCVVADLPCEAPGVNHFTVELGFSADLIVGAQFEITYDTTILQLKQIEPGVECDPLSPFILEIYEEVDPLAGVIRYAVGVNVVDPDHGTHGPATLACLTFNRLTRDDISDVCVVEGMNPFFTRITAKGGDEVPIDNSADCPTVNLPPALTCEPVCRIPTVSAWGAVVMTLLLLTGAKLRFRTDD